MKRVAAIAAVLFGVALPLVVAAPRAAAEDASPPCVTARPEAIPVGGAYNHVVHLTNACDRSFVCTVFTDVNPQPQQVSVQGRASVDVLTFRASPARVFVAHVSCDASP